MMEYRFDAYEQRIRRIERRATCFFIAGLLCLIGSGILIGTRPATSQRAGLPTFRAPFQVTNARGKLLFEIVDNTYGGKMILYDNARQPILTTFSDEHTAQLVVTQEPTGGGSANIGANANNGYISLEMPKGKAVFRKP